jgi:CRP/FNR family transcriptional regulator
MRFSDYFPMWEQLTEPQRRLLEESAIPRTAPRGTILHNGDADCVGLLVVASGQLRAFILSGEGREITLYRLFERDICLFSASCVLHSVQFQVTIEAETDSRLWVIPPKVYQSLMETSLPVANYTNQLMASRFSEVMWLIEQILWKSFDRRLAEFLLTENTLADGGTLKITHDRIASHMGTAREVVTRMLRYFQSEGLVALSRGTIELRDAEGLRKLAAS